MSYGNDRLILIGAGEGLATQQITIRVRRIDVEKLRTAIGAGTWGGVLAPVMSIVDQAPKLAIDMALPIAKQQLDKLGVTADLAVADPPLPPRARSEAVPAFLVGTFVGVLLLFGGQALYHRLQARKVPT